MGETGPAHRKKFMVALKLGEEEYTAESTKIKKAQHLAAQMAIEKTAYAHPLPKALRPRRPKAIAAKSSNQTKSGGGSSQITPTVELNALAMKLGQEIVYVWEGSEEPAPTPTTMVNGLHPIQTTTAGAAGATASLFAMNSTVTNKQRTVAFVNSLPIIPETESEGQAKPCKVSLIMDKQKFIGVGKTFQKAKHDAAAQALKSLKAELKKQQEKELQQEQQQLQQLKKNTCTTSAVGKNVPSVDGQRKGPRSISSEGSIEEHNHLDNKSPISLVFEYGLKKYLAVSFYIVRETGPAHLRKFTTACVVGSMVVEGEGSGKKISKQKAAENMLEKLRKLPDFTTVMHSATPKNKCRTNERPMTGGMRGLFFGRRSKYRGDPIRKLLAWHSDQYPGIQPEFRLVTDIHNNPEQTPGSIQPEKYMNRCVKYVMEVKCANGKVAVGSGTTAKWARINAAKSNLKQKIENNTIIM